VTSCDVLLIPDVPGCILDRLAKAWRAAWTGQSHRILYSSLDHPFTIRREGDRARLLYWIDPLAFSDAPNSSSVPQVVMAHHLTAPEIASMTAALEHADAITTPSRRWQKRLEELTGRQIWLVPATLDTRVFAPRPDSGLTRQAMGVGETGFVIGFSARAQANAFGRKGIDLLVSTLGEAARRWDDLVVLLIGGGWETLIPRIEALGCRVINRIPDTTEATADMYPLMNVFLCTSSEEGGPSTILEAMACGVPVITTDVGHVPEVVADGVTGFVARERAVTPFIQAITALRASRELAVRIAGQARTFVESERDHDRVLPYIPYADIYREAESTFNHRRRGFQPLRAIERSRLAARYVARTIRNRISG
jgi:glycosyltransferase involved in cell wall biosynthesis